MLLPEPEGHGHPERIEVRRGERVIRLEEPCELQEGLVVKHHEVDSVEPNAGPIEAVADGLAREPRIVLLPAESFLWGGRDDAPRPR
jgi:hypothetical protein